jgi:electron transfer flavoprotein beta subunit
VDIAVCIKQIPEAPSIGWDRETGTLLREGVSAMLNPVDKNVIEAALQLKERCGGLVTAFSMGPGQAEEALREALSMGVDKAVLVCDKKFAGADTLATSYTLSLALKKMGGFELILCGKESADGMTAHVGPQLAEFMNLPHLTYALEIEIQGSSVRIKQKWEDGYRIVESPLPALVTVERELNEPRITSMDRILEAYRDKEVRVLGAEELEGDMERFGLKGSPTQSRKVYHQELTKGKVQILTGESGKVARELVELLNRKNLI